MKQKLMIFLYLGLSAFLVFGNIDFICLAQTLISYFSYLLGCVVLVVSIRFLLQPPQEVFRKLLHMVAVFSCIVIYHAAGKWEIATLTFLIMAGMIYPVLCLLEKWPYFNDFFVQRSPGEVIQSMVLLFLMMSLITAVSWGLFAEQLFGLLAILMWGLGDAAAALIGKRFGHHIVSISDGKKTWEGSFAMFLTAFIIGVMVLFQYNLLIMQNVVIILITACFAAFTELITFNGLDTLTVPVVNLIVLLILHAILVI